MGTSITWGKQEVDGYALELEGWAVGVTDKVDEQEIAHLILSHNVDTLEDGCASRVSCNGAEAIWRIGTVMSLNDPVVEGQLSAQHAS